MGAASHALAVGVEHQRRDIAEAVGRHCFREAPLEPLDREGGGNLPDKASGIRKAGLHRHAAALAGIGAVSRLGEQRVEEAPAVLQRRLGLEQGRDVDLALHPEELGEIERGEHRGGLFALGDQHPDRRIGIDVLQDLRRGEELADRGRAFGRERGEIGAQGLRLLDQLAQGGDRALAGEV